MSNEMWEQTADFRIEIRAQGMHAFCKKCEEAASWTYKGLDPALPQIELKCPNPKCGNRQTYKLYSISHGFPARPVSSNPSVM